MAHAGFLAIARFFDSVVDAIRQFTIRGAVNTSRLVFTDARIANGWVLTHKQQKRVFLGFVFHQPNGRRTWELDHQNHLLCEGRVGSWEEELSGGRNK